MASTINNGMCRCCASEGTFKDVKSTYHWMGDEEIYSEMLRECFDISLIEAEDGNDGGICEVCITQLRNAANFKKQVQHTEEQFKLQLEGKIYKSEIVKIEPEKEEADDIDSDNNLSEDYSVAEIEIPIKTEIPEEPKPKKRAATAKASTSRAKKSKADDGETSTKQGREAMRCQKCNVEFKSTFNLKRHLRSKHDLDAITTAKKLCECCGKVFFNKDWLDKHLALGCPKSKAKVCVKCNIVFDQASEMYTHMRRMHWAEYRLRKWNCPLCEDSLRSHSEHDAHLSTEHQIKLDYQDLIFDCMEGTDGVATKRRKKKSDKSATPERVEHRVNLTTILQFSNASPFRDKTMRGFSCLYCAKVFQNIDDLRAHTAQQSEKNKINRMIDYKLSNNPIKLDITNLHCKLCDTEMRDLNDLKDHLVSMHKKIIHKDIKDIILPFRLENGQNFTCAICSVVHISFKNLYHHMSSHYSNYCCKKCGAGYITIAALRKHLKTHYQGHFPCDFCEKSYKSLTKKRNHEKGVHKGGWLRNKCPHCPEIFVSYYDRNEHLVKVHNVAPVVHPCQYCNKTYKKKFELSRHIKHRHLLQRSFLCDICNAKFFSKRGLADHLSRHASGEVFSCKVCNKDFSSLHTLRVHTIKIHENGKKFQCGICKKTFVQKCGLNNHLRLHQKDLRLFKEFDDEKPVVDDRELTSGQIAENKRKNQAEKVKQQFVLGI